MKSVSKSAKKVLDRLTRGLGTGDHRKVDNSTAFMPVSVDALGGNVYAVAHNFEQNGDLMADPDMQFWRGPDDEYYPCTFQQSSLGVYREAVTFGADGMPKRFSPREQADLATFANTWMRNIKTQQGLTA